MAAPSNITTADLTGKYILNKTLSDMDKTDKIMQLQGVGWITRKALGAGTLTLTVKHYKDDGGVEHIDIDQSLSGVTSTREERVLDWEPREKSDSVFGAVVGKSRRTPIADVDEPFLAKGWLPDTTEHGGIESYVDSDTPKSKTTWIARQIWGFLEVNGERRYSRLLKFTGPKSEDIEARLVYDYVPA